MQIPRNWNIIRSTDDVLTFTALEANSYVTFMANDKSQIKGYFKSNLQYRTKNTQWQRVDIIGQKINLSKVNDFIKFKTEINPSNDPLSFTNEQFEDWRIHFELGGKIKASRKHSIFI